ncbi:MAG: Gfo/Idh/MocA family oxidoreductase [Verrucomicrobia bacterium]|nr:Gfo/Idh/MocA family oxidoreductase [Verrucomicrobiota bacterium]
MKNRRQFISTASVAALAGHLRAESRPGQKLRVGVMGLSRGKAHINNFAKLEGVEIAYVCDVDQSRLAAGAKYTADRQNGNFPKAVTDFRRILEDKEVDILSIAAPNFWHAPATILACDAGKHVYVEKPGSHNPREAELMVEAAQRTKRKVQMGNQRRSAPAFREGIEKLKTGAIGKLRYARCWYDNKRESIGKGKPAAVPANLDYKLWQGPVPVRPYKDNLIHYNWHWHWAYGGGELANNGVHALDIARWALGVDSPHYTSCIGGRYHFNDDQETPDTADATYGFGKVGMSWHGSSCLQRKHEKHSFVSIYGDGGIMSFDGGGYRIYDNAGKLVDEDVPKLNDVPHFQNFINAIRKGEALNAEISDAQKSTMLCHLGNISYREGLQIKGADAPKKYWQREYSDAWRPAGI